MRARAARADEARSEYRATKRELRRLLRPQKGAAAANREAAKAWDELATHAAEQADLCRHGAELAGRTRRPLGTVDPLLASPRRQYSIPSWHLSSSPVLAVKGSQAASRPVTSAGRSSGWLIRHVVRFRRMTNRNTRRGKLAFLLIALVVLAGFQPGPANTQDIEQLRKDAEQGDATAQYNLGVMYAEGQGVPQDYQQAVNWFRKAAEQGYASAQYNLGFSYATGEGVPQDYQEAVNWWRKAAEQGYTSAQFNLAVMYAEGRGVPQDYQEAVGWYRKAAEQGHDSAQYNLGAMYAAGRGVPQDYIQAHKWVNLAASRTTEEVAEDYRLAREKLAEKMTASQVTEAQRLAREWRPKS